MITEKIIVSIFSDFWTEALPLLTPSFVTIFNEAYCDKLADLPSRKFAKIEMSPNVKNYDLVAEFAFCAAETVHKHGITITDFANDNQMINEAYRRATTFLTRYQQDDYGTTFNNYEIVESLKIAKQYGYFFEHLKMNSSKIIFRPKLKGSGFLGSCTADLLVDDTLYEIKTVTRNISGKDIRQILIYLFLQSMSSIDTWKYGGFFNPRKAEHYRFYVDNLIQKISGGRSKVEVFDLFRNFLGERGVEIDGVF